MRNRLPWWLSVIAWWAVIFVMVTGELAIVLGLIFASEEHRDLEGWYLTAKGWALITLVLSIVIGVRIYSIAREYPGGCAFAIVSPMLLLFLWLSSPLGGPLIIVVLCIVIGVRIYSIARAHRGGCAFAIASLVLLLLLLVMQFGPGLVTTTRQLFEMITDPAVGLFPGSTTQRFTGKATATPMRTPTARAATATPMWTPIARLAAATAVQTGAHEGKRI